MNVDIQLAETQVRIAYLRSGNGAPLILLPGVGSRKEEWSTVLDRLADRHDVVAMDLPGFGASGPLPDTVASDVDTLTDAVAAAIDALGLGLPHVAGNSLGGAVALELARRGRVVSTTAVAPIGFWSRIERWYAVMLLRAMHRTGRALRSQLPAAVDRPALRRSLFALTYRRADRMSAADAVARLIAFLDAEGFVRTLRTTRHYRYPGGDPPRVTVCWGTRDRLLPPRQAKRARRQLRRARHVWLPGCGHVAMSDDPALVSDAILSTTAEAGSGR